MALLVKPVFVLDKSAFSRTLGETLNKADSLKANLHRLAVSAAWHAFHGNTGPVNELWEKLQGRNIAHRDALGQWLVTFAPVASKGDTWRYSGKAQGTIKSAKWQAAVETHYMDYAKPRSAKPAAAFDVAVEVQKIISRALALQAETDEDAKREVKHAELIAKLQAVIPA